MPAALSPKLQGLCSPDFGKTFWADAEASDDDLFSGTLGHSNTECDRSSSLPSPVAHSKQKSLSHTKHQSLDLSKPRSGGVRKSSQRDSLSPKMAQPSVCRGRNQDTWARKIEANASEFDFCTDHNLRSPPPSAPLPQTSWSRPNSFFDPDDYATAYRSGRHATLGDLSFPAHAQFTPLSSPLLDSQVGTGVSYLQSPTASYFSEPAASQGLDWSFTQQDLDYPYEGMMNSQHSHDTAASANGYPTSWKSSSPDNASTFRSAALPGTSANHGSMIDCNISSNSAVDFSSYRSHQSSRTLSHSQHPHVTSCSQQYPPVSKYGLSQQPSTSNTFSARWPLSPPATPRSRKGSRGPRSNHRRSKTATGISERRSTAHAATGAGFVNYTPDDSTKILHGVAPSGSSKTKARREKEAADKRRRLSLAAAKAVMEAGGDVEELRRCGLLV